MSRAIIVLDADNKVIHMEQVSKNVDEPDDGADPSAANNAS